MNKFLIILNTINGFIFIVLGLVWIISPYDAGANFGILVIPEGSYQINVAQHIYETIVLSLPLKKIHPGIKNGTLKSDILEKLKALEPKKNNSDGSIDPRWNKLKDLL